MVDGEEQLDSVASAQNRRDTRRAVIITVLALATVLVASLGVVLASIHP